MQNPYLKKRRIITLHQTKPARTKQSFKDECDIKNIINLYNKTGLTTHINQKPQQNIDHTQIPNYQDTLNFVTNIQQQYDQLPQEIKQRFTTTTQLSNFLENSENHEEAQKLGLLPPTQKADFLHPTEQKKSASNSEPQETTNPQKS